MTKKEFVESLECNDLCFLKTKKKKSDSIKDAIYDKECSC